MLLKTVSVPALAALYYQYHQWEVSALMRFFTVYDYLEAQYWTALVQAIVDAMSSHTSLCFHALKTELQIPLPHLLALTFSLPLLSQCFLNNFLRGFMGTVFKTQDSTVTCSSSFTIHESLH